MFLGGAGIRFSAGLEGSHSRHSATGKSGGSWADLLSWGHAEPQAEGEKLFRGCSFHCSGRSTRGQPRYRSPFPMSVSYLLISPWPKQVT